MKKTKIALLTLLLTSIIGFSQTEKGKIYVGANSNFNFTTSNTDSYSDMINTGANNEFTQIHLNTEIGYFLVDNFVTGVNANYSSVKQKNINATKTYTISGFAKYYFLEKAFKPFIRLSYGYGKLNYRLVGVSGATGFYYAKVKPSITTLKVGTGFAYFFNKTIGLDFSINYFRDELKNPDEFLYSRSITSGFTSALGFTLLL